MPAVVKPAAGCEPHRNSIQVVAAIRINTIGSTHAAISELSAKRRALLKEAVPDVRAVAVVWNADDLGMTLRYRAAEVEAKRLGMQIVPLGVHAPDDFDAAFAAMTESRRTRS